MNMHRKSFFEIVYGAALIAACSGKLAVDDSKNGVTGAGGTGGEAGGAGGGPVRAGGTGGELDAAAGGFWEATGGRATGGHPMWLATGGAGGAGGYIEAGGNYGVGGQIPSPGLDIDCWGTRCTAKQFPLNYQTLSSDGSRTAMACCPGYLSNRCGLWVGGGCVELGQPGSPNSQCRGALANPGPNEASFAGCCRPDGTCGYLDSALGLGCFFSTALSANAMPDWCAPDSGTILDAAAPDGR